MSAERPSAIPDRPAATIAVGLRWGALIAIAATIGGVGGWLLFRANIDIADNCYPVPPATGAAYGATLIFNGFLASAMAVAAVVAAGIVYYAFPRGGVVTAWWASVVGTTLLFWWFIDPMVSDRCADGVVPSWPHWAHVILS